MYIIPEFNMPFTEAQKAAVVDLLCFRTSLHTADSSQLVLRQSDTHASIAMALSRRWRFSMKTARKKQWGGARKGAGRPRSKAERCACGKHTKKCAAARAHHC